VVRDGRKRPGRFPRDVLFLRELREFLFDQESYQDWKELNPPHHKISG